MSNVKPKQLNQVTIQSFGMLADGSEAFLYTLINRYGQTLTVTNYGANIVSMLVADRYGNFDDIVLGYDTLKQYEEDTVYLGAVVGRYAGRISNARFSLDNKNYQLTQNHGNHHIHGGFAGLNHKLWHTSVDHKHNRIEMSTISLDGEEGYPGLLEITVSFSLSDANEVIIEYTANTNKSTVINLTQHVYMNLAGHASGDIGNHQLQINADKVLICDAEMIPTGEIKAVDNSPFDLRELSLLNKGMDSENQQIQYAGGYDHYWLFDQTSMNTQQVMTYLLEPKSGRSLSLRTDQPGVVFYSGNNLQGPIKGKGGQIYHCRSGLCLETQCPADAPNHEHFASTRLEPEQTFHSKTIFAFGIDK